jgi:hypothetical protein
VDFSGRGFDSRRLHQDLSIAPRYIVSLKKTEERKFPAFSTSATLQELETTSTTPIA